MSYNAKNYTEQGGEKTVIGGEIVINGKITVSDGGEFAGFTGVAEAATAEALGGVKAAARSGTKDTVEVKIDTSTSKLYVPTYPVVPGAATTETAGIVRQAANVTLAEGAPTKEKFNALITALIEAGLMAAEVAE